MLAVLAHVEVEPLLVKYWPSRPPAVKGMSRTTSPCGAVARVMMARCVSFSIGDLSQIQTTLVPVPLPDPLAEDRASPGLDLALRAPLLFTCRPTSAHAA